jgi:hypothetical protein
MRTLSKAKCLFFASVPLIESGVNLVRKNLRNGSNQIENDAFRVVPYRLHRVRRWESNRVQTHYFGLVIPLNAILSHLWK